MDNITTNIVSLQTRKKFYIEYCSIRLRDLVRARGKGDLTALDKGSDDVTKQC